MSSSPPGGPIRPAKLSHDAIVDAALEIIDADGIEALSMRSLGRALDVRAMSIYRHLDSKEAVLDAVQERILTELSPIEPTDRWQDDLALMALDFRRVLRDHPHAIPLFARPAATAGAFDALSRAVDLLVAAGFTEEDAILAFQSTLAFLVGHALWQFDPDGERPADDEFAFGLSALITGFEAKLR